MLVTAAAARMDSAAASPAWLPTDHRQGQNGPAPSPSAAPVPQQHHPQHPRSPARRRVAKRRPRPSRRLPTTFISADPASFRRMVHQVTGADDAGLAPPMVTLAPPFEDRHHQEALCCRSSAPGGAMLLALPTLDTSALLLAAGASASTSTSNAAAARAPATGAHAPRGGCGSATGQAEPGGAAGAAGACGGRTGGGFPTLESWDADALLY